MIMFDSKKFHFNILSVLKLSWGENITYAHARPYHALSLRLEGDARFSHEKSEFFTQKNELIYVPKDYDYTIQSQKKETVLAIHFDAIDADFKEIETFRPINADVFIDLFEKIHLAWQQKSIGYEHRVDSLFSRILENIKIQKFRQTHSMKQDFSSLLDYIHSNFTDPALTVELFAKKMNISATYLRQLFMENLGTTPLKYLNNMRVDYATALLQSGYYTVEEVSEMSGYNDPKYFSTSYKKHTGLSPMQQKNEK